VIPSDSTCTCYRQRNLGLMMIILEICFLPLQMDQFMCRKVFVFPIWVVFLVRKNYINIQNRWAKNNLQSIVGHDCFITSFLYLNETVPTCFLERHILLGYLHDKIYFYDLDCNFLIIYNLCCICR
jgi:hypothetical protein